MAKEYDECTCPKKEQCPHLIMLANTRIEICRYNVPEDARRAFIEKIRPQGGEGRQNKERVKWQSF